MKQLILTFTFLSFLITNSLFAQNDDRMKMDNLKYYLSSIKDNIQSMRYYTDSVKVIDLLDKMSLLSADLEEELNKVSIQDTATVEASGINQEPENSGKIENLDDYSKLPESQPNEENDEEKTGISKYMPFKNKFNTNFVIQFGVNGLQQGNATPSGLLTPEINTGGSWYWDFALTRRARLGGKSSKVAINYGISFLKNRFKIQNDLRLTTTSDGNPNYVNIADVKENPKLNVGYLNVPLSLSLKMSKKLTVSLGGYIGYRIHTVQKFHLKTQNECIEEQRYSSFALNNWMYGATFSIDIGGFDLITRYNISKLFKDNPNYDYNTFMIGTSISLF